MSQKTITKFFAFVISFSLVCLIFSGCSSVFSSKNGNGGKTDENSVSNYDKPKVTGKIESGEITESSGIAASKCQTDIFWTHNDSGDNAFIFALNKKGERLGTWKVTDAKNVDWEDIAEIKNELMGQEELFLKLAGDLPKEMIFQRELLISRL